MELWLTLLAVALVIGLFLVTSWRPDLILGCAIGLLVLTGTLTPAEALKGFSNQAVLTIALLYLVVGGLQHSGGMLWLSRHLLGSPASEWRGRLRMITPVIGLSAFMNNTPVVALMIPAVQNWCKRLQWDPARFLLPLSYASILGGICSLIGTSTNLVVAGLALEEGLTEIGLFDVTPVGLPCAAVGLVFLIFLGPRLLPKRNLTPELRPISWPQDPKEPNLNYRGALALGLLAAMVLLAATGLLGMFYAALGTALAMLVLRFLNFKAAARSVDWSVLIAIALSFGLSEAIKKHGLDRMVAQGLMDSVGQDPFWVLVVFFLATSLLTELVTNNATAVLMFPIALSAAAQLGVSPLPFIFAVMIAASSSFSSPMGYQTNLMVYGPGGYRFSDYLRLGVPMNLLIGATALCLLPWLYPF
ncbi:MAG: SLC13 family permease [bacterium]|nr:SLC13 family permease [bacterium]